LEQTAFLCGSGGGRREKTKKREVALRVQIKQAQYRGKTTRGRGGKRERAKCGGPTKAAQKLILVTKKELQESPRERK